MTEWKQHSISSSIDGDFLVTEISQMSTEYYTENRTVYRKSVEIEEETNFFAMEEERLNIIRNNCEKRISILDEDIEDKPRNYFYQSSDEIFGSPKQKNNFDSKLSSNEDVKSQIFRKAKVTNESENCEFSFSEELQTESMTPALNENLKKVGAKLIALAHQKCFKDIAQKWFSVWKEKVVLYKNYDKIQALETLIISKKLKEKFITASLQLEDVEANFKLLEDKERNNLCRRIFIRMCQCIEEVYTDSFKIWREHEIKAKNYARDLIPKDNGLKTTQKVISQGRILSYEVEKKKIEILNQFFWVKNMIKHKHEIAKMNCNHILKEYESIKRQGNQTLMNFDRIHKKPQNPNISIFNDLLEKSLYIESSSNSLEAKINTTKDTINYYKNINKNQLLVKDLINCHESKYALYIKAEQNSRYFNTPLLMKEPISYTSKKSTYYTSSHKNSSLNSVKKNIFPSNEKFKKEPIIPKRLIYQTHNKENQDLFMIILVILSILLFYAIYSFSGNQILT